MFDKIFLINIILDQFEQISMIRSKIETEISALGTGAENVERILKKNIIKKIQKR